MLKREEYRRTVVRPYKPFLISLISAGSANQAYFEEVLDEPVAIRDLIYVEGLWYYSDPDLESITVATAKKWPQPAYLERAKTKFAEWSEALLAASYRDFATYCAAYEHYMPTLQCIWQVEDFVETTMHTLLEKKLSKEEADELMHLLNVPLQDNYHKQEEYALVTSTNLSAHVQAYEWLYSRYGQRKPYTIEQAQKRLSEIDRATFLEKWDREKRKLQAVVKSTKELLGEDGSMVDLMQFIIFYRTQRTDVMNRSTYQAGPLLLKEAEARNLSYEQFMHCTKDEILTQVPSQEILNERIKAPVVVIEDGRAHCLIGKEQAEIRSFLEETTEKVTHFAGSVACRGLVTGTVRVIRTSEDFSKVGPGDIIVTPMTTPVMIPIMKIATAFVTDEGGITCHAAIISREMKKPCIIGTKIATRTLKDGDRIEVDANKGVVTIL